MAEDGISTDAGASDTPADHSEAPWSQSSPVSKLTDDTALDFLLRRLAGTPDAPKTTKDDAHHWRAQFEGNPRFKLGRWLGGGGFGSVFEADDTRLGTRVALKILGRLSPTHRYHFKQEFRIAQQVVHPALVRLFELFATGDTWFFTMEIIDGCSWGQWSQEMRGDGGIARSDAPWLAEGIAQLVQAIAALHHGGILHRDLKPSNVRVSPEGKVVVLDFGLAQTHGEGRASSAGTPGFMAPELLAGAPPSPASDLYAVGVILHMSLTGKLPGDVPTPPPGPGPLPALCAQLLSPDPSERPTPAAILSDLGREPSHAVSTHARARRHSTPLLGRDMPLAALRDALVTVTQTGRPQAAWLVGARGSGRTRLLDAFTDEASEAALCLRGACSERENLPFRTFDGLIDDLCHALQAVPPDGLRALLPQDSGPLVALFPTLAMVIPAAPPEGVEPPQMLSRGLAALRALLMRMGRERPIVMAVDDLQWSDEDSALPLVALLRCPQPLPLLLVGTTTGPLGGLEIALGEALDDQSRRIPLIPLARSAMLTLCQHFAPGGSADDADLVSQAEGLPGRLLAQIRAAQHHKGAPPIAPLTEPQRALVTVVHHAPAPVPIPLALRAVEGVSQDGLKTLELAGWLRQSAGQWLTGHDALRAPDWSPSPYQSQLKALSEAITAAQVWAPEHTAQLWSLAGDTVEALTHLRRAAETATAAMAFHRAASLYEAIALREETPQGRFKATEARAQALANAGRTRQAANVFWELASGATGALRWRHMQSATELTLACGEIDEGLARAEKALTEVGLPGLRLSGFQLITAWYRLRGSPQRPQSTQTPPPEHRRVLDQLWSIGLPLATINPRQGFAILNRHRHRALAHGDLDDQRKSLAVEALLRSMLGRPDEEIATCLGWALEGLSEGAVAGEILAITAVAALVQGRFEEALRLSQRAREVIDAAGHGRRHIHSFLDGPSQTALMWTGQLGELRAHFQHRVDRCRLSGDRFAISQLISQFGWMAPLVDDNPGRAHALLDQAQALWRQEGLQNQRYNLMIGRINVYLYEGRGVDAWKTALEIERGLKPSGMARLPAFSVRFKATKARLALGLLETEGEVGATRRTLERAINTAFSVSRQMPWYEGVRRSMRARLLWHRGEKNLAIETLSRAIAALEKHGMEGMIQSAEHTLGGWMDDEAGAARQEKALAFFADQGVLNPTAIIRVIN